MKIGLGLGLTTGGRRGPTISGASPTNPLYIAHRGSGYMYPEYSLTSYDAALQAGVNILEQDLYLLTDSTLANIHDPTVDNMTSGTGNVDTFSSTTFKALTIDSDVWFRGGYGNLSPCLGSEVFSRYRGRAAFVPEAKGGGAVGAAVATALVTAGIPKDQAIIQAASLAQVTGALGVAAYPAMYVTTAAGVIADAQTAGATWAAIDVAASDAVFTSWISAGFKVVPATLQRRTQRDHYLGLGCVGMFADDIQYISRSTPFATRDTFSAGKWMPGMIPAAGGYLQGSGDRGSMSTGYWGFVDTAKRFVLMGWACPVKSTLAANNFTIDIKITFDDGGGTTNWAALFIGDAVMVDAGYEDAGAATEFGYNILFRANGTVQIFKRTTATATSIASQTGASITSGTEVPYRITVTPTDITVSRLNGDGSVNYSATVADSTYRGGYFHIGHSGLACRFRDIVIA